MFFVLLQTMCFAAFIVVDHICDYCVYRIGTLDTKIDGKRSSLYICFGLQSPNGMEISAMTKPQDD